MKKIFESSDRERVQEQKTYGHEIDIKVKTVHGEVIDDEVTNFVKSLLLSNIITEVSIKRVK